MQTISDSQLCCVHFARIDIFIALFGDILEIILLYLQRVVIIKWRKSKPVLRSCDAMIKNTLV
jgi:hypothetical protein